MNMKASMEFQRFFTPVQIPESPIKTGRLDPVWTVGSCFSDEIGRRMACGGFTIEVNPLGTLFNPASICRQLRRVASGKAYTEEDIFFHEGMWHSPDFHSSFSAPDGAEALRRMNDTVGRLNSALPRLRRLMLTLGSARVFRSTDTGEIVANCHKLPASRFEVEDLTAETIYTDLRDTLELLRTTATELRVIMTVSPIRHKAYGLHADKLSKARLLLAVDCLCSEGVAEYFPAYEIMTDELRDYRFYASDMIHPSETAADYIYSRFADTYFTPSTIADAARSSKEHRRSLHRPIGKS